MLDEGIVIHTIESAVWEEAELTCLGNSVTNYNDRCIGTSVFPHREMNCILKQEQKMEIHGILFSYKSRFMPGALLLVAALFIALTLSACKLTLNSFVAPQAADTGDVIVLNLEGKWEYDGSDDVTQYGIALQLPENWRVISARVSSTSKGMVLLAWSNSYLSLKASPEYARDYTCDEGYRVWVGTVSRNAMWLDQGILCSVYVAVADFQGDYNDTINYSLKTAIGSLRGGVWETSVPQGQFDFTAIRDDRYVESIDVTKVPMPFQDVTPEWQTYDFDHPFFGVVHAPTDDHFYVVQGDNKILELDGELDTVATITVDGARALTSITYLDGSLWVGDVGGTHQVYRLSLDDYTFESFTISLFPDGIGTDGKNIYVVDTDGSGRLDIVAPETGEIIGTVDTLVPDPVGLTYDGSHLLVLDESGVICQVDPETGKTANLFSAPGLVDNNTGYGPEGISYISGFLVIGYGEEHEVAFWRFDDLAQ